VHLTSISDESHHAQLDQLNEAEAEADAMIGGDYDDILIERFSDEESDDEMDW
jgi:hypothetical protein